MSQVVDDHHGEHPELLTFVRKARGTEAHKGGTLITPGDDQDVCITSWLAGHDRSDCVRRRDRATRCFPRTPRSRNDPRGAQALSSRPRRVKSSRWRWRRSASALDPGRGGQGGRRSQAGRPRKKYLATDFSTSASAILEEGREGIAAAPAAPRAPGRPCCAISASCSFAEGTGPAAQGSRSPTRSRLEPGPDAGRRLRGPRCARGLRRGQGGRGRRRGTGGGAEPGRAAAERRLRAHAGDRAEGEHSLAGQYAEISSTWRSHPGRRQVQGRRSDRVDPPRDEARGPGLGHRAHSVRSRDGGHDAAVLPGFRRLDADGNAAASSGDARHPFEVRIRSEIASQAPHLPGRAAPQSCGESEPRRGEGHAEHGEPARRRPRER